MDQRRAPSPGRLWLALLLPPIMVAALALRFPLFTAYPFQDEVAVELNGMVMAGAGTVHPYTKNWPTLVYFLQVGSARALDLVGLAPSPEEALVAAAGGEGFAAAGPYLQLGRALSALYAVAALLFAALLGRRLAGTGAGLWTAALLAAAPLHVAVSRLATTDVLCTALVLLSLWLAAEGWVRGGARGWLWGSAFAAGCAAGAKYTGGLAVVAPLVVVLSASGPGPLGKGLVRLLPVGAVALVGFLLAVPGMVTMPGDYLAGLGHHAGDARAGWEFFRGVDLPGYLYHPLHTFTWALGGQGVGGSLVGVAGLVGVVWFCFRRTGARVVLAPFGLVWFLVVGYTEVLYARYWAPFLPLLCLGLAWGVLGVSRRRPLIGHLLLAVALLMTLRGEVSRALALKREDTRVEAARRLPTLVPLKARIATLYPLRAAPEWTARVMDELAGRDPGQRRELVLRAAATDPAALFHLLWDSAYPALDPRLYGLEAVSVKDGGMLLTLEELKAAGVTHYLWSAFRDGMVEQAGPEAFPGRHAFLEKLTALCGEPELVIDPGGRGSALPLAEEETRTVWAADATRPGPLLKLYALP